METKEVLVKKIRDISGLTNHGDANLVLMAPVYAELICLLSREAEEQSRINTQLSEDTRDLTKGLHMFTKWLIGLTCAQVILGLASVVLNLYSLAHSSQDSSNISVGANHSDNTPNLKYDQKQTSNANPN